MTVQSSLGTEGLIRNAFDAEQGLLDRRVFSDEEIYALEMERIFARGWNFMCHDSQIPKVGDYVVSRIGEDQVIVVRDKEEKVQVMLNSCRHRGNALCRAEMGNAKSFVCAYHGWNFGLNGDLLGVPGEKRYYRGDFDKSKWGLKKAAQVDHFHGFWFASLDPDAPPLEEFLGPVGRAGISQMVAFGDVEVIDGIQKNVIECNWKIAVDNLFDWYHVMYSHASAQATGFLDLSTILFPDQQLVMLGEYGHGISGPGISIEQQAMIDSMSDEQRIEFTKSMPNAPMLRPAAAKELMGETGVRAMGHPNIFPNLWIATQGYQMCLRLPRGPNSTELWWYTVLPKALDPETREKVLRSTTHLFGPAGLLEQDDGENWSQSTKTARGVVGQTVPHNLQMGLGLDELEQDGQNACGVDTVINELGQRWTYQAWTDWMTAKNWGELKASHAIPKEGIL